MTPDELLSPESILRASPEDADRILDRLERSVPVRPGVVVMLDGNPHTRAALEKAGCEVHGYDGSEISIKGDGGPTCLTAPILRA